MATIPDGDGGTDPVAAARAGDPAAQAALIRRYYPMVHALCVRLLGDQDRALDIAQEAAVEAILGLDRLRHDDRSGAWMAGIGLNLCRRLVRDRDWAVFSLDALLQDRMIGEPADTGPGPAEAAEAAEIARRVKDAVSALPAGQRRIRFRRRPRPRADDQHPPSGQPGASGRCAGGLGRERHEPSHIGVAPGGSGTANAFSRNEISV